MRDVPGGAAETVAGQDGRPCGLVKPPLGRPRDPGDLSPKCNAGPRVSGIETGTFTHG
jgi:hypothetical protein